MSALLSSPPIPGPIARQQTSQVAILAFVSALLSWAGAAYAGPIAAIVCGRMAIRQIHAAPATRGVTLGGYRLARAAIVMGYVGLVVHVLATIVTATFAVLMATGVVGRLATDTVASFF